MAKRNHPSNSGRPIHRPSRGHDGGTPLSSPASAEIIFMEARRAATSPGDAQAQSIATPPREPSGRDVTAMLLGCAPTSLLTAIGLTRETSETWASVIELSRTALAQLSAKGPGALLAKRAAARRDRFSYCSITGLALMYAFSRRAWHMANPRARETFWQVTVPPDVLVHFGESLRTHVEDGQRSVDASALAAIAMFKGKLETLSAAEAERARVFSGRQKRKAHARWDGAAKAKYLPLMLKRLHEFFSKDACADHFYPIIEADRTIDNPPKWETVRGWLKGK